MARTTQDIPLSKDVGRKQMPLIVGLMVFLLAILLASALSIGGSFSKIDTALSKKFTITYIPSLNENPSNGESKSDVKDKIIDVITQESAIQSSDVITDERVMTLLSSEDNEMALLDAEDMPLVIDIFIRDMDNFNADRFKKRLRGIVPDIQMDGHNQWHHSLQTLSLAARAITLTLVFLIVIAILATITLITRSSLQAHKSIINTLRLIGARSGYISRQFQWQAFRVSILGGLFGVIVALPTLYGLIYMANYMGMGSFLKNVTSPMTLIAIGCIPFVISFLSLIVSRFSVIRMIRSIES